MWRDWLLELGIVQPFAQLYRETYRRADASHSDERFVGHVLLQSAVRSHSQQHGWTYALQGHWDSDNDPELAIPNHSLVAMFGAAPVAHASDDYAFHYLVSGPVEFRSTHDGARYYAGAPVAFEEVEPLVFSEVMRRVAAMVASTSIAIDSGFINDPSFVPLRDGWIRSAWGELSSAGEARADVVREVIARTVLRECATIDGRWLVIARDGSAHRIHIGSGFVQNPQNEPVDIRVTPKAKRGAAEIFLPFEGDALLRIMLGRALVLAGAC